MKKQSMLKGPELIKGARFLDKHFYEWLDARKSKQEMVAEVSAFLEHEITLANLKHLVEAAGFEFPKGYGWNTGNKQRDRVKALADVLINICEVNELITPCELFDLAKRRIPQDKE